MPGYVRKILVKQIAMQMSFNVHRSIRNLVQNDFTNYSIRDARLA